MINEILSERFWLELLRDIAPTEPLPGYQLQAAASAHATVTVEVPPALTAAIYRITGNAVAGRCCWLLTAWNFLLQRYTHTGNGVVATAAIRKPGEAVVNNVLFLRFPFEEAQTLKQYLNSVKDLLVAASRHQQYHYTLLQEKLTARETLFRFGFCDEGVQSMHEALQQCELLLTVSYIDDRICLAFHHQHCYHTTQIQVLAQRFLYLLEQLPAATDSPLSAVRWFSEAEELKVCETFNATGKPLPFESLPSLFRQTALRMPDKPAAVYNGESISYHTLLQRTEKVAACLVSSGVQCGQVVGICMASSFDLLVSVLAVLRAGAVVLPLVPGEALLRNEYLLKDSGAKLVITDTPVPLTTAAQVTVLPFSTIPDGYTSLQEISLTPDSPAYLIYTSGSTGTPKGVCLTQGNLHNMIYWFRDYFHFLPEDVLPQKTTISFVDAIVELLLPVTAGQSTVYLRTTDDISRDAFALMDWMTGIGATILQLVPSVFDQFSAVTDYHALRSLRALILSGEEVKQTYAYAFDIYNLYGCSEGTASSTIHRYEKGIGTAGTIGKPIYNTQVYLLDKYLRPVPAGINGEIYISGESIASGYWQQPALTAERFLVHPLQPQGHLYKTGDIGRWTDDGEIQFLGRADGQLKLRGVRIETGEIAAAMRAMDSIQDVFITVTPHEEEHILTAYLVCSDVVTATDIRMFLQDKLPVYYIPACFVVLEEIPRTTSGKVNRQLLPAAWENRLRDNHAYEAPVNDTEMKLAAIWEELLQTGAPIGRNDNFMNLGGHSLSALRMMSVIEKTFQVKILFTDFFAAPTLSRLATIIHAAGHAAYEKIPLLPPATTYALSHTQKRMWIIQQLDQGKTAYNLSHTYLFRGALAVPAFLKAFEALIDRHESLRTVFVSINGEVRQKILPGGNMFAVVYTDLREQGEAAARNAIEESIRLPFNLSEGPLVRMRLCRFEDQAYAFAVTLHHIITDGWSMQILISEILALYDAFSNGKHPSLPPLSLQYKDYAAWHNQLLEHDAWSSSRQYWMEKLKGDIPLLALPVDKPRSAARSYAGAMHRFSATAADTVAFQSICNNAQATAFSGLTAIVNLLLFSHTGQEDILIGSPVAGRNHHDLEGQIGLFLNNLVLRTAINDSLPFPALLRNMQQTVLEAFDHQFYPYDVIITDLHHIPVPGRNPLYDVMVVMAANDVTTENDSNNHAFVDVAGLDTEHTISKLDLTFFFVMNEQLRVSIEYRTDLFKPATIERIGMEFIKLLQAVIANPEQSVGNIKNCLMDAAQKLEQRRFEDAARQSVDETF
jgi:amino acid adenylation domain-containing protein